MWHHCHLFKNLEKSASSQSRGMPNDPKTALKMSGNRSCALLFQWKWCSFYSDPCHPVWRWKTLPNQWVKGERNQAQKLLKQNSPTYSLYLRLTVEPLSWCVFARFGSQMEGLQMLWQCLPGLRWKWMVWRKTRFLLSLLRGLLVASPAASLRTSWESGVPIVSSPFTLGASEVICVVFFLPVLFTFFFVFFCFFLSLWGVIWQRSCACGKCNWRNRKWIQGKLHPIMKQTVVRDCICKVLVNLCFVLDRLPWTSWTRGGSVWAVHLREW